MSDERTPCPDCGLPQANQWDTDNIPEGKGDWLCWYRNGCGQGEVKMGRLEDRIAQLQADLAAAFARNENNLVALDQNIAAVSRQRARAESAEAQLAEWEDPDSPKRQALLEETVFALGDGQRSEVELRESQLAQAEDALAEERAKREKAEAERDAVKSAYENPFEVWRRYSRCPEVETELDEARNLLRKAEAELAEAQGLLRRINAKAVEVRMQYGHPCPLWLQTRVDGDDIARLRAAGEAKT